MNDTVLMIVCSLLVGAISFFLNYQRFYDYNENKVSLFLSSVVAPMALGGGLAFLYVKYMRRDRLLDTPFD
jgi:hypothetical protein